MTLSLSLFVRSSVRSSVRPLFLSLVSLKSVAPLECYKASKSVIGIHWESLCVSRVFQECFKCVSREFQECFKGVSGSLKGVSRKFQGCFKEVSCVFYRSFKGVSR